MIAYLGLASEPAQVESIAAKRMTLRTARSYAPGKRMIAELVSDAGNFKCILRLRVEHVQLHPNGSYTWDAELSRPLTTDELRGLQ
jgi:hypothetical protein